MQRSAPRQDFHCRFPQGEREPSARGSAGEGEGGCSSCMPSFSRVRNLEEDCQHLANGGEIGALF